MNTLSFFRELLSDDKGHPSSIRFLSFFIIFIILLNWTYINLKTGQLSEFRWDIVGIILGTLYGKVAQKQIEKNTQNNFEGENDREE